MTHQAGVELYRRWLEPGDLVFDIGANVGGHTRMFLELGCRVVAVEPDPLTAAHIDDRATVRTCGVGAKAGEVLPFHRSEQDYLSTFSSEYIEASGNAELWPGNYTLDDLHVPMVTLDWLITAYGKPRFCKIDVEGYEQQVLQGLSEPLPLLSFEVHPFQPGKTEACLELLAGLGDYRFSYSDRETFVIEPWPAEVQLFGDIYAELA